MSEIFICPSSHALKPSALLPFGSTSKKKILKYSSGPRELSRYSDYATGWTVRGSNPGGGEIFRTSPDRPWGPPSLLYNGYRVFPGGKAAGGVALTTHPI
jgi:hypothetical protein